MPQAYRPHWSSAGSPFLARFDPAATWLTDLEPAFADRLPCGPVGYDMLPGPGPDDPEVPDEPGEPMVLAI